ncbi:hypothetical protein SORBI_3005G213100 [Sorghum bicolor]|uniref:Uncharacterized protein n=1 Tax=Sorghum bicolor TaxID=4558 RepID=A0A1B6PTW0_SORBI|nr:hypothetical protein SORBI_3005G213100 [Sorghum bicolor]
MNSLFSCLLVYWGNIAEKTCVLLWTVCYKILPLFCLRLDQVNIPIKQQLHQLECPISPPQILAMIRKWLLMHLMLMTVPTTRVQCLQADHFSAIISKCWPEMEAATNLTRQTEASPPALVGFTCASSVTTTGSSYKMDAAQVAGSNIT